MWNCSVTVSAASRQSPFFKSVTPWLNLTSKSWRFSECFIFHMLNLTFSYFNLCRELSAPLQLRLRFIAPGIVREQQKDWVCTLLFVPPSMSVAVFPSILRIGSVLTNEIKKSQISGLSHFYSSFAHRKCALVAQYKFPPKYLIGVWCSGPDISCIRK